MVVRSIFEITTGLLVHWDCFAWSAVPTTRNWKLQWSDQEASVVTLNASFSHCVEVTFKSILEYCGWQLTPKSITLAAPGPLLSEYVSEAAELVQNDNCSSVKDMDLYFNQTEYIRKPSNVVRQKNITKTRIKKNYVRPGALLFSPVWLKIEFLSRWAHLTHASLRNPIAILCPFESGNFLIRFPKHIQFFSIVVVAHCIILQVSSIA